MATESAGGMRRTPDALCPADARRADYEDGRSSNDPEPYVPRDTDSRCGTEVTALSFRVVSVQDRGQVGKAPGALPSLFGDGVPCSVNRLTGVRLEVADDR